MELLRAGTLLFATITVGLMAGAFALYANAIMPGLSRTDDRTFVGAFSAIDRAIINPLFLANFLGGLVFTALAAVLHVGEYSALPWTLVALVLYGASVVITLRVNVPLNDRIKAAGVPDRDEEVSEVRAQFDEARWRRWNLVRAVATSTAFGCLALAMFVYGRASTGS